MIAVSVAQADDLARVARLYEAAGYGGSVSVDDITLVVKQGLRVVGAVRLCSEGDFKVLRGMQVHPEFQGQGVGRALLDSCTPYLDDSDTYCLPYRHLVRFYARIQFEIAERHELPPLLLQRLTSYVSKGQSVLAMKRVKPVS